MNVSPYSNRPRGRLENWKQFLKLPLGNPNEGDDTMNQDRIAGNWLQLKGEAKRQWGKLTDDTLTEIDGSREKLAGKIQESYGVAKEDADRQIRRWEEETRKQHKAA
jgi:uncharacterized protein YjbJ (UPF0337 family)